MLRRSLAPAGALACLLVVAGCGPAIKSHVVAQDDAVGGLVRLTTELCADDGAVCDTVALGTGGQQLLVAYALPDGAEVERVFTEGTHAIELVESPSFAQMLDTSDALPAGRRWVAFRSDSLPSTPAGADPVFSVVAEVDPPGRTGRPVSSLTYDARIAHRSLDPAADPAAPFDCSVDPCSTIATDLADNALPLGGELAIRDAGLAAGEPVTMDRGTTATVPVTVRYAGATASGALPVTTTATVPGATTEAADVAFAETGEATAPVTLKVPDSAPAGDYALTVEVAGRRVTVPVHVDIPPAPALDVPAITFPETRVGRANGPRNVLITNPGTRALTMRSSEVTATEGRDFGIVADECAGRTLAPGAGCIVALQFAPTAGGDRAATLRVANSYRDATVPLTGNGALVPGHKDLMLTLGTIAFAASSRREVLDRGGLVFTQHVLMPGDAAWRLRLDGVLVAPVLRQRVDPAGERRIRLVLSRAGRRALVKDPTGRLVLTTAFTDADGRRSVVKRSVALARG